MTQEIVPAATYAVWTHDGHIKDIGQTWDKIWSAWIESGNLKPISGAWALERYDERWNAATASGPVDIYVAIEPPPATLQKRAEVNTGAPRCPQAAP